MPGGGGGGALTSSTAYLSADVSMASANTFYDGPSLSLAAGTWLLLGSVETTTSGWVTAKLWDGTTVASAVTGYQQTSGGGIAFQIAAIVAPSATTTYKISAASQRTAGTMNATPANNGTGTTNKGCYLLAIKIA